jgi:bis(5'-adenosyl)-triphosphatase
MTAAGSSDDMKPRLSQFKFGAFNVTSQVGFKPILERGIWERSELNLRHQVFYSTPLSFALVNIKPLLPGHVLVSPIRSVPRFSGLSSTEATDLFLAVRQVSSMIERVYKATSLNIAIQDGPDAGQSVPHLHVHVIPRSKGDLDDRGGTDAIYDMMDGEEGNVGKHLKERDGGAKGWTGPDAEVRKPRSEEEMREEADMLRREMEITKGLAQE